MEEKDKFLYAGLMMIGGTNHKNSKFYKRICEEFNKTVHVGKGTPNYVYEFHDSLKDIDKSIGNEGDWEFSEKLKSSIDALKVVYQKRFGSEDHQDVFDKFRNEPMLAKQVYHKLYSDKN